MNWFAICCASSTTPCLFLTLDYFFLEHWRGLCIHGLPICSPFFLCCIHLCDTVTNWIRLLHWRRKSRTCVSSQVLPKWLTKNYSMSSFRSSFAHTAWRIPHAFLNLLFCFPIPASLPTENSSTCSTILPATCHWASMKFESLSVLLPHTHVRRVEEIFRSIVVVHHRHSNHPQRCALVKKVQIRY